MSVAVHNILILAGADPEPTHRANSALPSQVRGDLALLVPIIEYLAGLGLAIRLLDIDHQTSPDLEPGQLSLGVELVDWVRVDRLY